MRRLLLLPSLAALALVIPTAASSHRATAGCPETGVPLSGQPFTTVEGSTHFTTVRCSYSDGTFNSFELTLAYEPRDVPVSMLPPKKPDGYCSGTQQKPHTAYSANYFGYSHVSGSPTNGDQAFAVAVAWLAELAGIAHSCTLAPVDANPPAVQALASQNAYPRPVKLKFRVTDDSGAAKVGAVVFRGKTAIARFAYRNVVARGGLYWFTWTPPASFKSGVLLTFCVSAVDAVGHKSADCGHLSVLSH